MLENELKDNTQNEVLKHIKETEELFKQTRPEPLAHDVLFPKNVFYTAEADFYKKMATDEGRIKRNNIQASAYEFHIKDLYLSDSAMLILAICIADLISLVLWLMGMDNAFFGMIIFTFFGIMALTESETLDFTKGKPIPELKGQLAMDDKGNLIAKDKTELKAFMDWISALNVRVTSIEANTRYELMLIPNKIYSRRRFYNEPEHNGLEFSGTLALETYVHVKQNLPLALAVATSPDTPGPAKYDAERSIEQLSGKFIGDVVIELIEGSKDERERRTQEAALLKEQIKLERERAERPTKAEDIIL